LVTRKRKIREMGSHSRRGEERGKFHWSVVCLRGEKASRGQTKLTKYARTKGLRRNERWKR